MADNCVLLAKLVARGVPFQSTTAPGINPPPCRLRVNAAAPGIWLGGAAGWFSSGTGFPMPTPDKAIICGLSGALSVNVMVPVRGPVAVGLKLTVITQLAPGPTVAPQVLF